jgi:hypothetical protein
MATMLGSQSLLEKVLAAPMVTMMGSQSMMEFHSVLEKLSESTIMMDLMLETTMDLMLETTLDLSLMPRQRVLGGDHVPICNNHSRLRKAIMRL